MLKKLKRNNEGFTIIEVLIVLAIAGLIMLIVFLAVPTLQRNSRNNGRNNDASRVAAAVQECLANHNGVTGSCDTAAEINVGTLNQLTTAPALGTAYSLTQARWAFSSLCNAAGDTSAAGGGLKQFTVTFRIEPAQNRCIQGA